MEDTGRNSHNPEGVPPGGVAPPGGGVTNHDRTGSGNVGTGVVSARSPLQDGSSNRPSSPAMASSSPHQNLEPRDAAHAPKGLPGVTVNLVNIRSPAKEIVDNNHHHLQQSSPSGKRKRDKERHRDATIAGRCLVGGGTGNGVSGPGNSAGSVGDNEETKENNVDTDSVPASHSGRATPVGGRGRGGSRGRGARSQDKGEEITSYTEEETGINYEKGGKSRGCTSLSIVFVTKGPRLLYTFISILILTY